MEPGHEDREYVGQNLLVDLHDMPQWSPVMKTGNTGGSWITQPSGCAASMEPGHEDREYIKDIAATPVRFVVPQWSPVMKTGNTFRSFVSASVENSASMEPGHEDREYPAAPETGQPSSPASMEPGHEDREYGAPRMPPTRTPPKASMEPGHEDREYAKAACYSQKKNWPQWSPVMKTGNTPHR